MSPLSRQRRAIGLLTAACLSTLAGGARADELALDRFQPAAAGDRFFGVPTPAVVGDPGLHLQLLGDYAHDPLVVTTGDHEKVGSVVSSQLALHVQGALALWERLLVDVDLPLMLRQKGDGKGGTGLSSPSGADVGDLRVGLRLRLVGEPQAPFQLAIGGRLWAPTGSGTYTTDGSLRGEPQLLLGGQVSRLLWTLSTGLDLRPSATFGDTTVGSRVTLGAGAAVLLGEDRHLQIGPEATVSIDVKDANQRSINGEALLGARYRLTRLFEVGAAAGPGLSTGIGTPDVRVVGLVAMSPEPEAAPSDRDKDGVVDAHDACPDVPGPKSADTAKNGCPPPPDRDRDGILDTQDACPDVAGVADADAKKNGCPVKVVSDRDKDGIADEQDACPDVAGVADADAKKNGCPPDKDGDGVLDAVDACVDVPGVASADAQVNGCPADADGDGIENPKDACPRDKGKADKDPKRNGCPLAAVQGSEIVILEQVQFDTAKATIKPVSNGLLDMVAGVFKAHPEITAVEVQGHTDNKGNAADNQKLSQARAEAVREALIKRGVAAERLTAKGYGQDVPVADNNTADGRQKNRRVQFKIAPRK